MIVYGERAPKIYDRVAVRKIRLVKYVRYGKTLCLLNFIMLTVNCGQRVVL